MINPRWISINI